jgi:NAD(P)-dependent dehydrogenase (short-subunit alcohol dehydrogenase family)
MRDGSCVVTGVGPGTGAALARRFAADGYRVAMLARDAVRLEKLAAEIPGAHPYSVDVADLDALRATLARVREELGPPSVLRCCSTTRSPAASAASRASRPKRSSSASG